VLHQVGVSFDLLKVKLTGLLTVVNLDDQSTYRSIYLLFIIWILAINNFVIFTTRENAIGYLHGLT
jgi:hypothetical protein